MPAAMCWPGLRPIWMGLSSVALTLAPGGQIVGVLARATGSLLGRAVHYARMNSAIVARVAGGSVSAVMTEARNFLHRKPPAACGCFVAGTLVWTAHGMVELYVWRRR